MKGITPHPKANMKEFHLHVIVYHLTSRTSNLSNNSTFSHILELVCVCVCFVSSAMYNARSDTNGGFFFIGYYPLQGNKLCLRVII